MPYRYGRLKDGTRLQGLIGSDGPFAVPPERHKQNLADAHGLALDAFDLVETDVAPDLSEGLAPPMVPPTPADERNARIRALLKVDVASVKRERDAAALAAMTGDLLEAVQALVRRNGV